MNESLSVLQVLANLSLSLGYHGRPVDGVLSSVGDLLQVCVHVRAHLCVCVVVVVCVCGVHVCVCMHEHVCLHCTSSC